MKATQTSERPPKMTRHELVRYILADHIDAKTMRLQEHLAREKAEIQQLENALSALGQGEVIPK